MVDVGGQARDHRVAGRRPHRDAAGDAGADRTGTAKKGDVLGVARIAGIQAAKRTRDLIPLCHPLALTRVGGRTSTLDDARAAACAAPCTVETVGRTGVEMEALTAVQVGAADIYDMCKAVDRGMMIGDVRCSRSTAASRATGWPPATRRASAGRQRKSSKR